MSAIRKIQRNKSRLGTHKTAMVCPTCKRVVKRGRAPISQPSRYLADEPCSRCKPKDPIIVEGQLPEAREVESQVVETQLPEAIALDGSIAI